MKNITRFIYSFCLGVVIVSCGSGSNTSNSSPPTISIINDSSAIVNGNDVFTPARISNRMSIYQDQLNEIAAAWGKVHQCKVQEEGNGDYKMIFTTSVDPECGPACHFVDSNNGQPIATVNPTEAFKSGNDPLLEASHEIDEMCMDPNQNLVINGILAEICDPVVCWTYCEGQPIIAGVPEQVCDGDNRVPDFVLPSYFNPNGLYPYDKMGLLKTPRSKCN